MKNFFTNEFIKGMDVSTLIEEIECGAKYYENGVEDDCIAILKRHGCNSLRLRLWLDPYDSEGNSYGAGGCDLECLMKLAKKGKDAGIGYLLDLHYSDFWTDPGKQIMPKAWEGLDVPSLEKKVYEYTCETISILREADLLPHMVQVGNEVTNGLLWPQGSWDNHENMTKFLSAGIRAVREQLPDIPVMLHLDCGGNNERCREWFSTYISDGGEDFDVIGLSYYPFWHGTLDDLEFNMNDLASTFKKDIVVAEVSMGFSMEDYGKYEQLEPDERMGYATRPQIIDRVGYPMTKEGQCDFMTSFMKRVKNVCGNAGKGFYYWEPAWIPVPGSGWATPASLKYMNSDGKVGNEWANQALFDYEGNVNPALSIIGEF